MDVTRYPSMEARRADVERLKAEYDKAVVEIDEAQDRLLTARDEERKAWRAYWQALEAEVIA